MLTEITRTPLPARTSGSQLGNILEISRATTVPRPSAKSEAQAPQVPFQYHSLNDWESLFWVSLCMILNRPVKATDDHPEQSIARLWAQRKRANRLFCVPPTRSYYFCKLPQSGFEDLFGQELGACLREDLLPVAEHLVSVRRALVQAYVQAEANPDVYPDRDISILHMACAVVPHRGIRAHLEGSGDIEMLRQTVLTED